MMVYDAEKTITTHNYDSNKGLVRLTDTIAYNNEWEQLKATNILVGSFNPVEQYACQQPTIC